MEKKISNTKIYIVIMPLLYGMVTWSKEYTILVQLTLHTDNDLDWSKSNGPSGFSPMNTLIPV